MGPSKVHFFESSLILRTSFTQTKVNIVAVSLFASKDVSLPPTLTIICLCYPPLIIRFCISGDRVMD